MKTTITGSQVLPLFMTLLILLILPACKPEVEQPPGNGGAPNEEELITTVRATFIKAGGGDTATFLWQDLDGDGGNAPVIIGDTLETGASYSAVLLLLNASVSPADTISQEVAGEAEAHQFFFSTTGSGLAWAAYADSDANGLPIGLATAWTTSAAGSGEFTIVLRHQPNKGAAGVSAGDITNAGGETDIDVSIPYRVE